jgi:putative addiction module component (TIGR02574 family)
MNSTESTLLQAVLALPAETRAEIAEALLLSLDDSAIEVDDDELEKELQRRSAEMDANPSAGVPWSELKKLR